MAGATRIPVQKETRAMLFELGSKGQTYDEIIREPIERASMQELDARWNRILREQEFIALDEA